MSQQTQNRLQEIFNSFQIDFDNLYNIVDSKTKKRVNTYIEEWQEKGLIKGYFGTLAKNIYNRIRVKNSEILELLIYGAYVEEQNNLEDKELQTMKEDVNYYYQAGQQEVNQTLPKNKQKTSIIEDALFLYLLSLPNSKGYVWNDYIEAILKYNADQIYRQAIIDLQQQKELDITNDIYQNIIQKQQNQRLNINGDKISGDIDLTLIGLNNQAKVEGIRSITKSEDAQVRFIALTDEHSTKMCQSMNNMLFYINKENEFDRYWGETQKELTLMRVKIRGLVLGINLPPIMHHFHFCRSTITYITDLKQYKELNSKYKEVTNRYKKDKKYNLKEQNYFIDNEGNRYSVDGKNVKIKANDHERKVANIMGKKYGGDIRFIPVVLNPKGIKTPDYMINGKKYDLKEIFGSTKNTLYNALSGKQKQADNFIFDISKTKLKLNEIIEQVNDIYNSKHRSWVNQIIIIKDEEIIRIFERQ